MAFARASAFRGALRAVRSSKTSVGRAQTWRQIGRRSYASHGQDVKAASSDIPWFVGAVAVTLPACWYLLQPGSDSGHGHGGHDDAHGEDHDEDHEEGHEKQESKDESESSDDDKSNEKGEDSDSGDESKENNTPDTSDDEGDKDEQDGTPSEAPATPKGDKKVMPDAKGGNKIRTDSEKGQKQGKPEDMAEGAGKGSDETPASSKTAGGPNSQSGKQEGLSNTDTKHSTDITNNPEKSRKGEGTPETSKTKGTVDPKRPQV